MDAHVAVTFKCSVCGERIPGLIRAVDEDHFRRMFAVNQDGTLRGACGAHVGIPAELPITHKEVAS